MAVSTQDIVDFLQANPGMSDADIAKAMEQYGVTVAQMSEATGLSVKDVANRLLTQQILAQGITNQWQGEGKGSADANAADMAKILVDTGITDLSQFGKVTKTVDVAVQPVYDYKEVDYGGETGVQLSPFIVGYTDQNGNSIDPSLVKTDVAQVGSGENTNYETVYVAPIGKEEVFGNKVTGQEVANTYGERQTGNAFGGTYTGKGNTAYNVQFDESGKPVFYTTGASSSDTKDIARIIQAGLLLSGAGGALGGALGLTGAAAQGVGTGLITAGSTAIGGGSGSDILKAGLLGGGIAYGGNLLGNYLDTGSIADPGITERQLAIADAKQLADQGLSQSQIADVLGSSGYNEVMVESAIKAATKGLTPTTIPTSTAATDVVNVTGTAAPAINTGGLLSSLVTTPTALSTPAVTDAGTVKVTGTSTPQQVDQAVLNLVNSQLSSNVSTPANLANVQVTGTADKGMMSNADTTSAILNTLTGLPTTPTTTTTTNNLANVEVTGQKPATTQELASAITSAIPSVTPTQAAAIAEQVITSGKPVTNQEVISAITAALPPVTAPTTVTTQPVVPEQTITAQKPTTINDVVTAAAIPLIQPSTPLEVTPVTSNKTNELGLTDAQMLNLLKGGIGLLGGLGGAAALTNTGGTGVNTAGLPTQLPPMYTGDYFTKVQQNYNQLLPAVPRDVASPLRDWYLSQYGA